MFIDYNISIYKTTFYLMLDFKPVRHSYLKYKLDQIFPCF